MGIVELESRQNWNTKVGKMGIVELKSRQNWNRK